MLKGVLKHDKNCISHVNLIHCTTNTREILIELMNFLKAPYNKIIIIMWFIE